MELRCNTPRCGVCPMIFPSWSFQHVHSPPPPHPSSSVTQFVPSKPVTYAANTFCQLSILFFFYSCSGSPCPWEAVSIAVLSVLQQIWLYQSVLWLWMLSVFSQLCQLISRLPPYQAMCSSERYLSQTEGGKSSKCLTVSHHLHTTCLGWINPSHVELLVTVSPTLQLAFLCLVIWKLLTDLRKLAG